MRAGISKVNKPRREAPRRNVMESKHTEAAPDRRAEDGGAFGRGRPRSVWVTEVTRNGFETTALWAERTDVRRWTQPMFLM